VRDDPGEEIVCGENLKDRCRYRKPEKAHEAHGDNIGRDRNPIVFDASVNMPSEDVLIDGPPMPAKPPLAERQTSNGLLLLFGTKKPPGLATLTRFQPFVDSSIFGRLGPAAFTQPRLRRATGASSFKPKSSGSRFTAGAFGFFDLIKYSDRPET
jgi:hypothetical protein